MGHESRDVRHGSGDTGGDAGHSRIQMVLRYAHPTDQQETQAMRKLEEFNAAKQIAEFEATQQQSLRISLQ